VEAFMVSDWLDLPPDWSNMQRDSEIFPGTIDVSHWNFDGSFQRVEKTLSVSEIPSMEEEFAITDLMIYPLSFAGQDLKQVMLRRGRMFWKCRKRNYVCYKNPAEHGYHSTVCVKLKCDGALHIDGSGFPRFMVDISTYHQMHPLPEGTMRATLRDDIGPELMLQDDPDLDDDFFLCLPNTQYGSNMQKHEWGEIINKVCSMTLLLTLSDTLEVGYMEDVLWDKDAFDLSVIDRDERTGSGCANKPDTSGRTDRYDTRKGYRAFSPATWACIS
jgi:hypothetical protein